MHLLISLGFWFIYFLLWISLFILNFIAFRKFSGLDVDKEILEDHNEALASIIRWQLIGQAIMISSLIYFLWTNVDSVIVKWQIDISYFIVNIADIAAFWILGIIIFQATINILAKIIPLHKEIMIDQNISIWKIIEWLLIAISLILSFSIYSY